MHIRQRVRKSAPLLLLAVLCLAATAALTTLPPPVIARERSDRSNPQLAGGERSDRSNPQPQATAETVVLADPGDPYYSLAQEVAAREELFLVSTLDEALAADPEFLLWVVSPGHLSDEILVDFALALRDRPSAVSTGILSGASLDDARALWLRAGQVRRDRVVAANAENPSAGIPAGIHLFEDGEERRLPLTLDTFVDSLRQAGYLTFTGHGGASYLGLAEHTTLRPGHIPHLPPAVIATGSCNTFRLWSEDSLALTFVARGAAAYAGFAYSPNEGFLIGEFDGLPMRYTWPGFPIGHVVQVQNRGTLQGFAHFPYYFLLGDPRIALGSEPAYHLVEIEPQEQGQILRYAGAPPGVIPVRVAGGAAYHFVEIPGVGRTWTGEPFYNARVQMVDLGDDKLVLFEHGGGDFSLYMHRRPPLAGVAGDVILDTLDTTLLFLQQGGGATIFLVVGLLASLPAAWHVRRRGLSRRALVAALWTGLGSAVLHGLYALARLDRLSITSKPVHFHPATLAATFLLAGCGALLYLRARSWRGRGLAVVVAALGSFAPAIALLGLFALANQVFTVPRLGVPLWNNHVGLQPLIAFAVEAGLFAVAFAVTKRMVQPKPKEVTNA
ncbi:MAG: hypothetical protein ACP5JJ_03310 [Anaerolineae bacterium]